MKKQFTLLSAAALFATGISFSQVAKPANVMKKMPTKLSTTKDIISTGENTKAGGDIIWDSDFSDATEWTATSNGQQGGFTIGNYPSNLSTYVAPITGMTNPLCFFDGVQYLIAGTVQTQDFAITSETIDMSASSVVTISFNQTYRRFNYDATYVEVSADNGATWISKKINTEAVGNGASLAGLVTFDFNIGAGVTEGKVRFRWESLNADNSYGSGYGWAFDNVKVLEGYENNLKMKEVFSALGTQGLSVTKIPTSQISTAGNVSFGAIIENVGTAVQPTSLGVTAGTYTGESAVMNLNSFAKDTFAIVTADGYAIPTTTGTYNFTFTALSEDNILEFTGDDSKTVPFEVTQTIMAADAYNGNANSYNGSFFGWQGGTGDAEIGTFFEIFNDEAAGAVHIGIASVAAGSQADYVGNAVFGKIYEVTADDYVLLNVTNEHTISSTDFGKTIRAYFQTPTPLEAGKAYLVTAGFYLDAEVPLAFSGFVADGNVAGVNGADFVGLAPNEDIPTIVECPVVRLDFKDYTNVAELDAAAFGLSTYPNPFNNAANVAFELKAETEVSIAVQDVTGRVVATVDAAKFAAGKHNIEVNTQNLNAGVYNYVITLGNQVFTQKMIKK